MSIPTPKRPTSALAFSLIEVVLALGVIAFALVAILGVFPVGFAASRTSISDTRAAQVISAITATIDGQCASFANITCYGETLDLTNLNTDPSTGAPAKTLYVTYPSPDAPVINNDVTTADWIYSVEMKFDNDPPLDAIGTKLGPGKLNKIQLRVRGRSATEGFVESMYLARNRS